MDLPTVGGHIEGVWNEDNGGVYFDPLADDCYVRGNPLDSHQMQAGQVKERGNTTPMVVVTAHGLGRPLCNWVRRVIVRAFFFSFLYGGEYAWWVQDDGLNCVGLSLV